MKASAESAPLASTSGAIAELTAVPRPSATVCANCHTWKAPSERWCENCEEVREALGVIPLSPSFITLYAKPSRLRDWLTRYKGRPGDEDPWERESEDAVEAIIARFILEHGARLADATGPVDRVVVVPSTDRLPPHPLELVLDRLALDVPVARLLERTLEPIGFRLPNAAAYRADPAARGERVLLMDDVYTTGAHINSAATALRSAGACVVGALVVARRINPDYREEMRVLWEASRRAPFTWATGPYVAGVDA